MKTTKKLLYMSRYNNDFERFIALADALGQKFSQIFLHIYPLERLPNRKMIEILQGKAVSLYDPGAFCAFFKAYVFFNEMARSFGSSRLWKLGQYFFSRAMARSDQSATKILDKVQPDLLFITFTPRNYPLPIYQALHKKARSRAIPIFVVSPGTGFYGIPVNHVTPENKSPYLAGDYLISPNDYELEVFMSPDTNMEEPYIKKMGCGDPRLARPFVEKLHHVFLKNHSLASGVELNPTPSVAIFGNNIAYLSDGNQEEQDRVLLKIIDWLVQQRVDTILLRFHPQTPETPVRSEIISKSGVKTCPALNTSEVLTQATHVVSPPTSVLFEAMILKKPLLVVDDFASTTISFSDLGVTTITSQELQTLQIDSVSADYSMDAIRKYVWGGGSSEDCRDRVVQQVEEVMSVS